MPGLYGFTGNANVAVSDTPGLYINSGASPILTNAQQLLNLLSNDGTVYFQLDPNTGYSTVEAFANVSGGGGGTVQLIGDVIAYGATGLPITATLANVSVVPGTYGSNSNIPIITVDAKGRVTSVTVGNVATYLPGDPTIAGLTSNVAILQSQVYTNANTAAYVNAWAPGYLPTYLGSYTGNISAGNITTTNETVTANLTVGKNLTVYGNITYSNTNIVTTTYTNIVANATTPSIDSNTGAIISYGGIGAHGNINAGGNISTNVNVVAGQGVYSAQYFWANGQPFQSSVYSNANVTAYLAAGTDPTINAINANLSTFETYANVSFASNAQIQTISANLGAYQIYANANAASQQTSINTINANVGAFETYANASFASNASIASINANLGAFETYANVQFSTINANVGTLYLNNISTQANLGAFETYANVSFNSLATGANANTAAYLLGNTIQGNIKANTVTIGAYGTNVGGYPYYSGKLEIDGGNGGTSGPGGGSYGPGPVFTIQPNNGHDISGYTYVDIGATNVTSGSPKSQADGSPAQLNLTGNVLTPGGLWVGPGAFINNISNYGTLGKPTAMIEGNVYVNFYTGTTAKMQINSPVSVSSANLYVGSYFNLSGTTGQMYTTSLAGSGGNIYLGTGTAIYGDGSQLTGIAKQSQIDSINNTMPGNVAAAFAFLSSNIGTISYTNTVVYSSAGTYTWQAPLGGVITANILLVGGGGGGGAVVSGEPGAGGAGGNVLIINNASITPNTVYTLTIGAGGGTTASNGSQGGSSTFSTYTVTGGSGGGAGFVGTGAGPGGITGIPNGGGTGGNVSVGGGGGSSTLANGSAGTGTSAITRAGGNGANGVPSNIASLYYAGPFGPGGGGGGIASTGSAGSGQFGIGGTGGHGVVTPTSGTSGLIAIQYTVTQAVPPQITANTFVVNNGGILWANGTPYSTGSSSTYGNSNVASYLASNISTPIGTTANVYAGNVILPGNGTFYGNLIAANIVVANIGIQAYTNYSSVGAPTYAKGAVWYDSTQDSLAYYNSITNNEVNVGQELQFNVYNGTASTINQGVPVYLTGGSVGTTPNVAPAIANTISTSQIAGVANQNIPAGTVGSVVTIGLVANVSMGSFSVGDTLYLSPYSAGQVQNTQPPTGFVVKVGTVVYNNSPNGIFLVNKTVPVNNQYYGNLTLTGNLTANNTSTTNQTSTGSLLVTGNATTGNITTSGNLTANNTSTTNQTSTGSLLVTGNATTGSLLVTGNATIGNITTSGTATVNKLVTTTGVFWSNGTAYSTGSGSTYGNTQVAQYLPVYGGSIYASTVNLDNPAGNINITSSSSSFFGGTLNLNSNNNITLSAGSTASLQMYGSSPSSTILITSSGARFDFGYAGRGPNSSTSYALNTPGDVYVANNLALGGVSPSGGTAASGAIWLPTTAGAGIFWANGTPYGNSVSAGVSQIVAGTGISISPSGGTGVVTITNTGGGTGTYGNANVAAYLLTPGPIGSGTPNTGAFTTLSTTGVTTYGGNLVVTSGTDTTTTTTGALVLTGSGGASIGGNAYVGNNLYVGSNALNLNLTTPTIVAVDNGSTYAQAAIQNRTNTGSADWIAYGNNYPGATNDHGWADVGFTGDAFNDPNYSITKANDAYLFGSGANATVGGNLVLATDYAGSYNDIVFGVGSFYANSEVARFHGNTSNSGTFNIGVKTTVANITSTNGYFWANGTPYSTGGSSGVSQIVAGTNVTISPAGGTGVVTINATSGGGGGSFSGNLAGNILYDSVNLRTFANAYPLSTPDASIVNNTYSAYLQYPPVYTAGVVQQPPVANATTGGTSIVTTSSQTVGLAVSSNIALQSGYGYGSQNRNTVGTVMSMTVTPVTANTMANQDRVRSVNAILDVPLSGKTWGQMNTNSQNATTLAGINGFVNLNGSGSAGPVVGGAYGTFITPGSGNIANVQYATSLVAFHTMNTTGTTPGTGQANVVYMRGISPSFSGFSANNVVQNAVMVHTYSGWAGTTIGVGSTNGAWRAYALLNEDAQTTIQTNGNVLINNGGSGTTTSIYSKTISLGSGGTTSTINIGGSGTTTNLTGNTIQNGANTFFQVSTYSASPLRTYTGSVGQIVAVIDSTPGGRLAFWDSTNTRWSYVSDNSAV